MPVAIGTRDGLTSYDLCNTPVRTQQGHRGEPPTRRHKVGPTNAADVAANWLTSYIGRTLPTAYVAQQARRVNQGMPGPELISV